MDCVACSYEGRTREALMGEPVCAICSARGDLRGSGAHGHPWYVRVFGRSVVVGECWEYSAARDTAGYGSPLYIGGRLVRPHRLVLEKTQPGWAEWQEADHRCHNRACVRPDHLRWVSHRENCRNRMKGLLTPEEKRIKRNAYHRAYTARNREVLNAKRKARNWGRPLKNEKST